MDVWFDSGSTHQSVLVDRGLPYPADLYLEGSDQYRGWFNSSLILGVAKHGKSPYKNLVSHGFIVDAKGMKMSKSLGNGVDPNKIVNVQGADILRLWASSIEYTADVRISDQILNQNAEAYRKIRNTVRFLMSNTSDFTPEKALKYENICQKLLTLLIPWWKEGMHMQLMAMFILEFLNFQIMVSFLIV